MIEKNEKITKMMEELTDKEKKIRMFYEIAKEVVSLDEEEFDELDNDMQELIEDITNVINDIEKL